MQPQKPEKISSQLEVFTAWQVSYIINVRSNTSFEKKKNWGENNFSHWGRNGNFWTDFYHSDSIPPY